MTVCVGVGGVGVSGVMLVLCVCVCVRVFMCVRGGVVCGCVMVVCGFRMVPNIKPKHRIVKVEEETLNLLNLLNLCDAFCQSDKKGKEEM